MAEYIERGRLLRKFNIDDMMNVNGTLISLRDAREVISNAPTADVAPVVHGRWERYSTSMMSCSICRKHTARHKFNYFPNCGARMEGTK